MIFEPGVPFRSRTPTVVVDAGLDVGPHRFELVVVNSRGERSQPVVVTVTVVPRLRTPLPIPQPIPQPIPIPGPIRPPIG